VVATIGNFDGVHRGHQALIGRVIERAAELGVQSAIVTFDPHPLSVIRPQASLPLLSTVEERIEYFRSLGVDHLLVWRFDSTVQHTSAADFLTQLQRYVRLRRLLYGPGFALGRGREGTPEVLARLGAELGFSLEEVTPFGGPAPGATPLRPQAPAAAPRGGGGVLSSTAIRALIAAGQVEQATHALGRPPTLTGEVVSGAKLGRSLGYPTANLRLDTPRAVPADGVYAAWAEIAPFTPTTRRIPAAVSIGDRPTFDGKQRIVEAYLLDFDGDLYGRRLRLHFVARLRGQERFDDVASLLAQMARDVEHVRRLLAPARDLTPPLPEGAAVGG
jgi:riboflavin kinase/FMN adenylyltransferase